MISSSRDNDRFLVYQRLRRRELTDDPAFHSMKQRVITALIMEEWKGMDPEERDSYVSSTSNKSSDVEDVSSQCSNINTNNLIPISQTIQKKTELEEKGIMSNNVIETRDGSLSMIIPPNLGFKKYQWIRVKKPLSKYNDCYAFVKNVHDDTERISIDVYMTEANKKIRVDKNIDWSMSSSIILGDDDINKILTLLGKEFPVQKSENDDWSLITMDIEKELSLKEDDIILKGKMNKKITKKNISSKKNEVNDDDDIPISHMQMNNLTTISVNSSNIIESGKNNSIQSSGLLINDLNLNPSGSSNIQLTSSSNIMTYTSTKQLRNEMRMAIDDSETIQYERGQSVRILDESDEYFKEVGLIQNSRMKGGKFKYRLHIYPFSIDGQYFTTTKFYDAELLETLSETEDEIFRKHVLGRENDSDNNNDNSSDNDETTLYSNTDSTNSNRIISKPSQSVDGIMLSSPSSSSSCSPLNANNNIIIGTALTIDSNVAHRDNNKDDNMRLFPKSCRQPPIPTKQLQAIKTIDSSTSLQPLTLTMDTTSHSLATTSTSTTSTTTVRSYERSIAIKDNQYISSTIDQVVKLSSSQQPIQVSGVRQRQPPVPSKLLSSQPSIVMNSRTIALDIQSSSIVAMNSHILPIRRKAPIPTVILKTFPSSSSSSSSSSPSLSSVTTSQTTTEIFDDVILVEKSRNVISKQTGNERKREKSSSISTSIENDNEELKNSDMMISTTDVGSEKDILADSNDQHDDHDIIRKRPKLEKIWHSLSSVNGNKRIHKIIS